MFCPWMQGAIIYLHLRVPTDFISSDQVPLPKFGFLTYGVYIVPLCSFLQTSSLLHIMVLIPGFLFRTSNRRQSLALFIIPA